MTMDGGFPLSQSPRTQGFQQPPAGPQDEEEIFSTSFRDLAYRAFQKTQPQLFPQVVTFRVLAVDAPNGEGVGAFIVKAEGEILFVPVVIADNAVKPLDMFYARSKDRFYPLTSEWVDRLQMDSVTSLGDGVKPPKDLNTDVDIRNVIVPPTTGRYSYAELEQECVAPFRAAAAYGREKRASETLVFPELLSRMPDGTKIAAAEYLRAHVGVFKKLAEVYGVKTLDMALRPSRTKVAHDHRLEVPMKHDIFMADASMPFQDVKKSLSKDEVGPAYQAIRLHGFYVKDRRKSVPNDVDVVGESTFALERPESSGLYRVFLTDGTVEKALVVVNPIDMNGGEMSDTYQANRQYRPRTEYQVFFQDGRSGLVDTLLAEPVATEAFEDIEEFLKGCTSERPGNDEHGAFVCVCGTTLRATHIFKACDVSSHNDLVTMKANSEFGPPVIFSKKMSGPAVIRPAGQNTMVIPGSYKWFKSKTKTQPAAPFPGAKPYVSADLLTEQSFLTNADMIHRMVERGVEKTASAKIYCVKHGSDFVIEPGGFPLKAVAATVKLASRYGVTLGDASRVVEATANGLRFTAYATPKLAAGEAPPQAPQPDPAAEAAAQAAMPPPPPSGMELALAEKMQLLQQQQASIAQMQQLVSELQQRAMGIDQGGGAMAAPMAAAGMQAGAPADPGAMAPVPGMPGDPAMAQGGAPQGAPQDPNAMAAQGAPQDPNAMPMDPNAMPAQGQDPFMGGM